MKKRIVLGILLGAAILSIGGFTIARSIAYLQDKHQRENPFTVGFNETQIIEEFKKPSHLNPGMVFTKKVFVKNTGDVPCYIRVRILPTSNPDAFVFDYDTENWTQDGSSTESWWYYNSVVQPGEKTGNLITEVSIREDLTGESSDNTQIIVYEESTQAYGYDNPKAAFQ